MSFLDKAVGRRVLSTNYKIKHLLLHQLCVGELLFKVHCSVDIHHVHLPPISFLVRCRQYPLSTKTRISLQAPKRPRSIICPPGDDSSPRNDPDVHILQSGPTTLPAYFIPCLHEPVQSSLLLWSPFPPLIAIAQLRVGWRRHKVPQGRVGEFQ